ncbi:hypothetical protein G6F57_013663 [Rhizopus arrhizus]|nr:hypothetical protein G6F57_013663 [Rhizopus arrhizus]
MHQRLQDRRRQRHRGTDQRTGRFRATDDEDRHGSALLRQAAVNDGQRQRVTGLLAALVDHHCGRTVLQAQACIQPRLAAGLQLDVLRRQPFQRRLQRATFGLPLRLVGGADIQQYPVSRARLRLAQALAHFGQAGAVAAQHAMAAQLRRQLRARRRRRRVADHQEGHTTPCGMRPVARWAHDARAGRKGAMPAAGPGRKTCPAMDAVARPPFSERALTWLKKEALPLLVLLGLLAAARDTLANHYVVPSGSMQPTLQPGDRVVVDMRAYGLRLPFTGKELMATGSPQRGEVAVFDSPADGTRLIKRVVAVAGDHVQLHEGHLSINGQPLQIADLQDVEAFGPRRARLDLDMGGGPDIADLVVPAGKVLVLGDHRGNSFDGRFFGFVDAD